MSGNCGVCVNRFDETNNCVKCTGPCDRFYHATCTRLGTTEALKKLGSTKSKWKCDKCDKLADVGEPEFSVPDDPSTTITKEFIVRMLNTFKEQISNEIKNYTKEVKELQKSVEFFSKSIDETNKLVSHIREDMSAMKKENEWLKAASREDEQSIAELRRKVRHLEDYSRRENIEISGIPETKGEDVMAVVEDVGKALGIILDRSTVVAAHRVPTYNKKRIPPVIVRFQIRDLKDAWISHHRQNRDVTAKKVNKNFPNNKIFISEHLCPDTKKLLAKCKERCKDINFKYVWVKDANIFVRKADKERCFKIEDYGDLEKIK